MVEFGLAKGLRDVVFADAARLPFVSGSFDVATTNHVLHLIPDWRDVLREIARVTRETYFTVIERSERVESIKREYDALVKGAGHDWSHPGVHEKDLAGLLKPDFVMPVGPFRETHPANSILEELNRRTYSSQWDVPGAIHRDAIERLRAEFGRSNRGGHPKQRGDRVPRCKERPGFPQVQQDERMEARATILQDRLERARRRKPRGGKRDRRRAAELV